MLVVIIFVYNIQSCYKVIAELPIIATTQWSAALRYCEIQ